MNGNDIMSDKDRILIEKAWNTHCSDWNSISSLINQAESKEAKERLRVIRNYKYHMDEYECGLL